MKKYGALVTLGLAVLFGVLAVVLANRWMAGQVAEDVRVEREPLPLTKVVVTTENIGMGMPLNANKLALTDWPRAHQPAGVFESLEEVEGRVAVTRLRAGQPVVAAELAAPGSGAGLVAQLPEGQRAIAIRVDDVSGVAGFVLPNSYVDVIVVESREGREVATIVLDKVRVLAIAQETHTEDGQAKVVRTVTLQLSPEDAATLALKVRQGSIHLTLRSPMEEPLPLPMVAEVEPEVRPEPEPEPASAPEPRVRRIAPPAGPKIARVEPAVASAPPEPAGPWPVEIIRGTQRQSFTFRDPESEELVN